MSTLTSASSEFLRHELSVITRSAVKFFDAIAAQRQAKAAAFVKPYLARLSQEELADLGYSSAEAKAIRATRNASLPYHL